MSIDHRSFSREYITFRIDTLTKERDGVLRRIEEGKRVIREIKERNSGCVSKVGHKNRLIDSYRLRYKSLNGDPT